MIPMVVCRWCKGAGVYIGIGLYPASPCRECGPEADDGKPVCRQCGNRWFTREVNGECLTCVDAQRREFFMSPDKVLFLVRAGSTPHWVDPVFVFESLIRDMAPLVTRTPCCGSTCDGQAKATCYVARTIPGGLLPMCEECYQKWVP